MDLTREERTVLFIDVARFFAGSPEATEEERVELLQEIYDEAGNLTIAGGGRLVKYIGDAVMASFPAERSVDAVAAALALRRSIVEMGEQRGWDIDMSAALCTGELLSGTVGHASHRVEDIFGPPINLAARLMGQGPGVVVCPELGKRISGHHPVGELEEARGQGFQRVG